MDMKTLIMERQNCSEVLAEEIEKDLKTISSELVPMLEAWVSGEELDVDKKYHGFTLNDLMSGHGLTFTGALLTLDWLIKDPDEATKAIRYGLR